MSSPEEIQREIERTRASLSADVDRLSDKVSPSQVISRRVDRVKGSATSVKERVMGSTSDAGGSVGSAASSLKDNAASAPQAVRRQTQGNPLAAGIIAFGAGLLAASLLPASQAEQQVAQQVQDRAPELAEPLKQSAQEVASNLQEPVQDSVQQVRDTAGSAASDTADQARSAVDDVKQPLQQ